MSATIGPGGVALLGNGSNSYGRYLSSLPAALAYTNTDCTVEFWFQNLRTNTQRVVVFVPPEMNDANGWVNAVTNALSFALWKESNLNNVIVTTGPLQPGWNYGAVAIKRGVSAKLYLNGTARVISTYTGDGKYPHRSVILGANYNGLNQFVLGGVSLRIYERELSNQEIASSYFARRRNYSQ